MKAVIDLKNWTFRIPALSYEAQVTVPHTWNVDGREDVQRWRGAAEYETAVALDPPGDGQAVLYFGAAYHTAAVTVNGRHAGGHAGSGYTPFELDVTELLVPGENVIRVTVDNAPAEEMLPHKLDFDWADDGGLIRPVRLTLFEREDLRRLDISYRLERMGDGLCSGELTVEVDGPEQEVCIEVIDCAARSTVLAFPACTGGPAAARFEGLRLWNPGRPALYTVRARTARGAAVERRVGFRTAEVRGDQVLLNGEPVLLKGCEWMPGSHPDWGMAEPPEVSARYLSLLKDAGCVFTRFHWQQDDAVLDWCDEHGLLVQEEIPYWGYPKQAGPMQLKLARRQAEEMVRYHGHHPSIICWGVGNELGGHLPETIDYVKRMAAYFKALDPARLVNYVSNTICLDDHVGLDDAAFYGDIVMWNEYLGLWQPCGDVEGTVRHTYEKIGPRPVLVSEFGLCEPAFAGGDERRCQILAQRIPLYESLKHTAGYVWFSLNDYRTQCGEEGEGRMRRRVHGSTGLRGEEKPSYRLLCALLRHDVS